MIFVKGIFSLGDCNKCLNTLQIEDNLCIYFDNDLPVRKGELHLKNPLVSEANSLGTELIKILRGIVKKYKEFLRSQKKLERMAYQ